MLNILMEIFYILGRYWQCVAIPLPRVPERRRRLPHPVRHLAGVRRQAHVLHGDGHGTVLADVAIAVLEVRAYHEGRRLRHDGPLPHR